MADIFISYSKGSQAQTQELANELRAKGFTVWYDTSLVPGDSFREVIMAELAQAQAAIVIWTADSVKSDWVCSEASRARARRILIPVRGDDVRSHDIPPPFDSLHTESLSNRVVILAALAKLGVTPSLGMKDVSPAPPALTDDAARPALALPDKPSIAILPFRNLSGDAEQEYFADGIAKDIITTLSRSPSLFVIARNSSFTYKGRSVDVKQIARDLGVRYVLEGSVRRGGNRVRIAAQLIDAETGNHLWAERYDRDQTDLFAVQDEITEAVAIAIEPTVAHTERQRALRKLPENLDAWEAYQRGLWHYGRIGTTENEAAKSFFKRALDLDPNFAAAHAFLALAISQGATIYQTSSLAEVMDEVVGLTQKAISLDPFYSGGHAMMANVLNNRGDHEGAVAEARQALALSPNSAQAHFFVAMTLMFSGQPRQALDAYRKAQRLDPHDPLRHIRLSQIVMAHYFLREYEAAIEVAKHALRSYPDHPSTHRWLAAALGQAGHLDEAKQALQKAIALAPKAFDMYVRQRALWWRVEDWEHMLEGLRKAGWEG